MITLGHHHHGLSRPDDKLSVMVMEAGIIFHSISTYESHFQISVLAASDVF